MDSSRHDASIRVLDACPDDAAVLALSVVRMIAAGYSTGDVACWDLAYAGAERVLDPTMAGHLVGCLTSLVRSVRATRRGDWSFMPASCCRVTGDECRLLTLLTAARAGQPAAVARLADAVAGGAPASEVQAAVLEVATVMAEVSRTLKPPADAAAPAALH